MEERHDIDLGDGHWLDWFAYDEQRSGAIITHTTTKTETGMCSASLWFRKNLPNRPIWEFDGNFDAPTFSPSFLCPCGDHGYVRDGKWVRA